MNCNGENRFKIISVIFLVLLSTFSVFAYAGEGINIISDHEKNDYVVRSEICPSCGDGPLLFIGQTQYTDWEYHTLESCEYNTPSCDVQKQEAVFADTYRCPECGYKTYDLNTLVTKYRYVHSNPECPGY